MRLNYKEATGGKQGALVLVNKYGWVGAAVALAKQGNIPGLCVLEHGLTWGNVDLVRGREWLCPSTRDLLESTFPDDRNELADSILSYIEEEYYGEEVTD